MPATGYFLVAAALYVAGAACAIGTLARDGTPRGPWLALLTALGLMAHTAGIGAHCATSPTHYFTGAGEVLWLCAWALTVAYLFVAIGWRMASAGALVLPGVVLLLTASLALRSTGPAPGDADDHSPYYIAHVLATFLSYGFILTAAALSALYLEEQRLLKRKFFGAFLRGLPSLANLEQAATGCAWAAWVFASLGLALGLHLAVALWPGGWYLNPKVLAAAATWGLLLFVAAARAVKRLRGRAGAQLVLAAVALMALTFVLGHPFRAARPDAGAPAAGEAPR